MTTDNYDDQETVKLRLKGLENFLQWHQFWRATLAVHRKWQETQTYGVPPNSVSITTFRDETVNADGSIVKRAATTATQQDAIDACKKWLIKSTDFNYVDIDADDSIRDIINKLTSLLHQSGATISFDEYSRIAKRGVSH